jgi:hypothetical protein
LFKLPPGAEAEIVNTAPAPDPDPYYFIKELKKFYRRKVIVTILILKRAPKIAKMLYRSWIRSRFPDLRLYGAGSGAGRNISGSSNTSVYDAPHPLLVPSTLEDGWMDHQLA